MAYRTEIRTTCHWQWCDKAATYKVFNNRNGEVGVFCTVHAKLKVTRLEQNE